MMKRSLTKIAGFGGGAIIVESVAFTMPTGSSSHEELKRPEGQTPFGSTTATPAAP